ERDNEVAALVCRGGLIDRAGSLYLDALDSRLLFIADTDDTACLASAERAFGRIRCEKETAQIDADDTVARKAIEWFQSVRDQGSGIR
ncbi:MAG: hypothetical protein LBM17_00830, partial [Candidatus Accumulibacter sp.]|nr:hypothetical protein [Accumulibacter sp.]